MTTRVLFVMHTDEYQHPTSLGSLASAQRCWLSLQSAGVESTPQQMTFVFDCPSLALANALAAALGTYGVPRVSRGDGWEVRGDTERLVHSREYLEHLFNALRRAGQEHGAVLTTLALSATA